MAKTKQVSAINLIVDNKEAGCLLGGLSAMLKDVPSFLIGSTDAKIKQLMRQILRELKREGVKIDNRLSPFAQYIKESELNKMEELGYE